MKIQKRSKKGFIISMELVFIAVILVFGLIAGWAALRGAVIDELWDLGQSFDQLDNGWLLTGVKWNSATVGGGVTAATLVGDRPDALDSNMQLAGGAQFIQPSTQTDGAADTEGLGLTLP